MIRKKIFAISGWTDTNNESSKNTDVKSNINKLNTNKRCQFLETIVPINETSEQNSNGYCNVDFVFTLDPTNASFICGIKVIFNNTNLYLYLKYLPTSNLLAFCGLTCVVSVMFCATTCTVTEVANGTVNASSKELQVCVWWKFVRHWWNKCDSWNQVNPLLSNFLRD